MNDLIAIGKIAGWEKLKTLVLDSVSSPITKRVYNMALDEFMGWFQQAPRPGFTKATVSAWRVSLEARGLGSSSIIIRMSAIRKLAAEAADNGMLAPELAAGISRVKSAKTQGIRSGNWLSQKQAQALIADLARVLRVPGTLNCKEPGNPKPVIIGSQSDRRYNPSDLAEFLDDIRVSNDEADEHAHQWRQQFQDQSMLIDIGAAIPEAEIARWIESDPRFKNTWFRHRSDLQDQSQSGYDLALANFGFRVGLTEQQIVDLIIHHRRIHKQKSRTTLDYFGRTLSKAAKHDENLFQSAPSEPARSPDTVHADGLPDLGAGQPKSDRERIDIYKQLSDAFGVNLLRLVKVTGDEPMFRMDLAEGSVSFSTVGKFISQAAVRTGIAGRVGRLIPPFKQSRWRVLAQMMLGACIVEDGGEELESQGAARLLIGQYLAETAFIPSIEGQSLQDLRKPMVRDDQITVCASDIHQQNEISEHLGPGGRHDAIRSRRQGGTGSRQVQRTKSVDFAD